MRCKMHTVPWSPRSQQVPTEAQDDRAVPLHCMTRRTNCMRDPTHVHPRVSDCRGVLGQWDNSSLHWTGHLALGMHLV